MALLACSIAALSAINLEIRGEKLIPCRPDKAKTLRTFSGAASKRSNTRSAKFISVKAFSPFSESGRLRSRF